MTYDWRIVVSVAIGISIAAGVVVAVEELLWMRRSGRLTRAAWREMGISLSPLPLNALVSVALTGSWMVLYSAASALAPWHIPVNAATLVLALLAADLCYYVEHRCAHRFPPLWALYHAVHHSSPDYTVATAYRVSFVNQLAAPIFYLPCVLAGFEPLLVLGLQVLSIHYQAWVHTESIGPLGALDRLFNTPANHRVHHEADTSARGVNFGGILVVWDRLFGTYTPPWRVRAYGIARAEAPRTWFELYAAPIRQWKAASRAANE